MKMLIYIKGKFNKLCFLIAYVFVSFDDVSISKKYVRSMSIFENISKKAGTFF